jgi:hypothetical protein
LLKIPGENVVKYIVETKKYFRLCAGICNVCNGEIKVEVEVSSNPPAAERQVKTITVNESTHCNSLRSGFPPFF